MPTVDKEYTGRQLAELRKLCKRVVHGEPLTEEDKKKYNCYYKTTNIYACTNYYILSEPHPMTTQEWLEVCDDGGYHFGGRREGNRIVVYID